MDEMPGRTHYNLQYLGGGRVFSYAHQIDSVLSLESQSVLEVGVGPGMVSSALRAVGIKVTTIDCQAELNPDVVASVTDLPFEDHAVDVSLCCQVLEHLPFDLFATSLRELVRVAAKGLILSLPDVTPFYEVRLRLPKLGLRRWTGTRRYRVPERERERSWRVSGHYWAIGYVETPLSRIVGLITDSGLRIDRTWRVSENPYHRFFIIDAEDASERDESNVTTDIP